MTADTSLPFAPWRRDFNAARDPQTARIALGITSVGGISDAPSDGVRYVRRNAAWTSGDAVYLTGNQTVTLSGDITGAGATAITTTIANNAVSNAKLADIATARIKGRVTAATGDPEDLTGTQATTLLDTFTSSLKGLAPSSGGGTTNFLRADGTWAAPGTGSAFTSVVIQKFTANGTYTPTSGMKYCVAECIGGGGGGGGATGTSGQHYSAGGGGSGGYSRALLSAAAIGASKTVTIGAGGSAGDMAGSGFGGSGGTTSLGSLCSANGGTGGRHCSSGTEKGRGGAGASASGAVGDVTAAGAPGGNGIWSQAIVTMASGPGGSSALGGGGVAVYADSSANAGNAASNYGSGGSGAGCFNIGTSALGGAGSAGIVIITEFM